MEERFGAVQVCSVGTFSALQLRAAIKDLSRVYGLEFQDVNEMMKLFSVDDRKPEDLFQIACSQPRVKKFVKAHSDLINEVLLVMPAPKAQSIHACATMIFPREHDMFHWVPIRRQGDEYVTEWEGGEMDAAGFLKNDILGVKQLDKFQDMVALIRQNRGEDVDIFNIPLDDPEVFRYFQNGWNEDNFHFGSQGLTGYCKQMRPQNITELIAAISLYRPGAMENGFHESYLKRRAGIEEVFYYVGTEDILKETYGIFCSQEQIMELCKKLGGLSLVEADDVRKAMVKKKYEALHKYHERFTPYYMEHFGVTHDYAESVWEAIDKASTYLFNKCISGKERIKRHSKTNGGWHPTIEEMYLTKNDAAWAEANGHKSLHEKYSYKGYGRAWSMNNNGDLVLNDIVDIRYQGKRQTLTIELENGARITVTGNHKFPTPVGFKLAEQMQCGDELYVYDKNVNDWRQGAFTDKFGYNPFTKNSQVEKFILNSKKGHEGFTVKEEITNFKKWEHYVTQLKKDHCEVCGKTHCRLECHHKDGDHANNELENLITVCSSCHKKFHYEMGRTVMGQHGVKTKIVKIVSITVNEPENVYDVEMADPYHTFVTQEGVVTCNSHAAAYAITGYISQYMKVHYPIEYWSVAFKYATTDDYPRYIAEINKTGVCKVHPVDINISDTGVVIDFEHQALYWSIMGVKQVAERAAEQIIKERCENGQYWSLTDFISRHKWKGSAVNSRVIQNLILAGAFDAIENLQTPAARVELLQNFLQAAKIKSKDDDPVVAGARQHQGDSWWWHLLQKQVSGLAFFDYQRIYDDYFVPEQDKSFRDTFAFTMFEDCIDPENIPNAGQVFVGGYVSEVEYKKTKNGKMLCRVVLEQNYEFMELVIFDSDVDRLTQEIGELTALKGNIIFANVSVYYDKRKEANALRVNYDTHLTVFQL